ncbi:alpha-L-rhamnosidase C [Plectosphaerella cucumerina]|uniref:Alpha-L-rhamnosidase C n=1 Tax=Plectosphaerella cucumerina TaxID=40658 RepID=A0A8K0TEP2_9PEZI|nr:alpha-L-rhamnosidase C [Plectosphaerella cucumerina]
MVTKAPCKDTRGDDLGRLESQNGTMTELATVATGHERVPTGLATLKVGAQYAPLTEPYPNGYHFPPSLSWKEGFTRGCKAFWAYTTTWLGFFVVLYGLNVVAWGGMLFLLLCNAAPAMCHPTCNDINSPRRKWIETTSQILNGLFCVTGFGLAPWRFRDLYYLVKWRFGSRTNDLRRLAGIHRGWFRLRGSDNIPLDIGPDNVGDYAAGSDLASIPLPESKIPDPPLTGVRAPATAPWKLDFVIWFNVWNTFLQCCLAGFMWGMNRYDRPSWSTGLFVGLAMVAAMVGGLMMFFEGKKVKSIEGIPVCEKDLQQLARDKEAGIIHYNNIKDKKPKEKGGK